MSDWFRLATFEGDDASVDALVEQIGAAERPPDDIRATQVLVLRDRSGGRVTVATRFASEADLQKGNATLDTMSPPSSAMRRVSVDLLEVVLERPSR